jgi:hypothetical protein
MYSQRTEACLRLSKALIWLHLESRNDIFIITHADRFAFKRMYARECGRITLEVKKNAITVCPYSPCLLLINAINCFNNCPIVQRAIAALLYFQLLVMDLAAGFSRGCSGEPVLPSSRHEWQGLVGRATYGRPA